MTLRSDAKTRLLRSVSPPTELALQEEEQEPMHALELQKEMSVPAEEIIGLPGIQVRGDIQALNRSVESPRGPQRREKRPPHLVQGLQQLREKLTELYLNPEDPGSLGGVDRLYRRAKKLKLKGATRQAVKELLQTVSAYTLHRQARRRFQRKPTIVSGIDEQWQADLVDMQALSRVNHGMKYILTCIDVFSKFAWAIPIKGKSASALVDGFEKLFSESNPRCPKRLHTDKGKEFLNSSVQTLLRERYNIKHFTSWSDQKAAVVERFNRTLKSRMWRYFSARQTNHYLDILPKLLQAYNHSWHRSIGAVPADVRLTDEARIWKRLYGSETKRVNRKNRMTMQSTKREGRPTTAVSTAAAAALDDLPSHPSRAAPRAPPPPAPPSYDPDPLLKPGAMVRISRVKGDFEKGYLPNWSEEDFRVREIVDAPIGSSGGPGSRRVYKLSDRAGEPIFGIYYPEELQEISENRFLVERIVRRRPLQLSSSRTRNNPRNQQRRECLVKWRGWPTKFNSWIPEEELVDSYSATA